MRIDYVELLAMVDSTIEQLDVLKTRIRLRSECKEKGLEAEEEDIKFLLLLIEEAEKINDRLIKIR